MDLLKLKVFVDDILNLAWMIVLVFERLENILGKEENAVYQHFLLFPQCFQKLSSSGSLTSQGIVWQRVKLSNKGEVQKYDT